MTRNSVLMANAVGLLGIWFGLNLLSDGMSIVMASSLARSALTG